MPFGMVSEVGQGMGELDGVHIPNGKRRFQGLFSLIDFHGIFECIFITEMYSTRA